MFSADIVELMQYSTSGAYLRDAVLSLGAMHAVKLGSPDGISMGHSYRFALNHYSKAVVGLRNALNQSAEFPSLRDSILWSTHLLGLFEVSLQALTTWLILTMILAHE